MSENLAIMYHNLYLMIDAGVPLMRALDTTAQNTKKSLIRRALKDVKEAVAAGSPIAEGMELNPRVFAPLDITIIQAAEASGTLPDCLQMLSDWYEFTNRITKRLMSGMVFPLVMIHAVAAIGPLPAFFLGGWNTNAYVFSIIRILGFFCYGPAAVVLLIRLLGRSFPSVRMVGDYIAIKVPVLGHALYKLTLARYCRIFYMLMKAGLPITQSAEKASAIAGNAAVGRLLRPAAQAVKDGSMMSEGFSDALPAELIQMWQVGEESGRMEEIARKLGDNFGATAELLFKELAAWLPRLAYAFVAGVIIYAIIKGVGAISGALTGLL